MSLPRAAPLFGEGNQAVPAELGCDEAEIKTLADEGRIGDTPFGLPNAR